MKKIITSLILLFNIHSYAQVGIGTTNPQTTLHVKEKRNTANINDINTNDGILIPRLTKSELALKETITYNSNTVNGVLVFVTDTNGTIEGPSILAVEKITSTGFYYLATDNKWTPLTGIAQDNSNDAWINNATKSRVEVGTTSTGNKRPINTEVVITDDGNLGINVVNPTKKLEINASTENNSTDGIKITNLITLPSNDSTLQIDANGFVGKKTELNVIGQILRIPIVNIYDVDNLNTKPILINTPIINTVANSSITDYVYEEPYNFTAKRINLPKGIYKIEVKIVGYFGTANINNSVNLKTLVNGLEYTNQDYGSNTQFISSENNYNGFVTTDFIELHENASIEFKIKNNVGTFSIVENVNDTYASLVLIQRLK